MVVNASASAPDVVSDVAALLEAAATVHEAEGRGPLALRHRRAAAGLRPPSA